MPVTLRALIVVATVVACLHTVRAALGRFLRADRVDAAQQTAGVAMEAMAGLYGVLVAFILAGAWERFDRTRGSMTLEAAAVADLRQIARTLPAPLREEFGAAVEAYRMSAVEEVASSAKGRSSEEPGAIVDHLWLILAAFEPGTPGQAELQSRAFDAVEELENQRWNRLHAVRRPLPSILWLILIGGAIAVLGVVAISSVDGRLPAAYLALLAAVVSLALYAIYALSYPVRSGLIAEAAPLLETLLGQLPEGQ